MSRKIIYVLLLFAVVPYLVFAGNGRIKGKVTDLTTGEALVGANVLVVGTSLGAATDVNGDPLSFEIAGWPTMGTLVLNDATTGSYTYTTNPGARGTDSFTFRAFDGQAYSNIGTITVTILKPNQ